MAKVVKTKTGKKIVLLNPNEKAKRYARQLKIGKVRETGKKLSTNDMAFRVGYLSAQHDNAKAFCAVNGIPSKAKKNDLARSKQKKTKFNKRGK